MSFEKIKRYLYEYKITILLVAVGLCVILFSLLKPNVSEEKVKDSSVQSVPSMITVDVSGAVDSPGVYELPAGSRVSDALSLGGGLSKTADVRWFARNLNLAEILEDSDKVYIPFEWEENVDSAISPNVLKEPVEVSSSTTNGVINVNTASLSDLKSLSGIGEVYAERIIKNRPFSNLSNLSDKANIPYSTLQKISDEITF